MRSVREQCVLFVLCSVILEVVPEQPRYKMIMFGLRTKPAPFLIVDNKVGTGRECGICGVVVSSSLQIVIWSLTMNVALGQTVICSLSPVQPGEKL